ncbi:MAG: hypothetical protein ACJAVZ_000935 [Afipia broomeae]|jgi:hypothetical protein
MMSMREGAASFIKQEKADQAKNFKIGEKLPW